MSIAERHVNDGFVYVVDAVSIDFPCHGHLGHVRVARRETEEASYVPNMHSIVKIVKELGNLHSCLAYFCSANYSTSFFLLPPAVMFYFIFSQNFCRLTLPALSIEFAWKMTCSAY